MHHSLIAYVPNEIDTTRPSNNSNLMDYLNEMMAPYREHFDAEPYRPPHCEMYESSGIGCLDCDDGEYCVTTWNPDSKWDFWALHATLTDQYLAQFSEDRLRGNKPTYAILAPEVGFMERERLAYDEDNPLKVWLEPTVSNWEETALGIYKFATSHGYQPVLIDYHI